MNLPSRNEVLRIVENLKAQGKLTVQASTVPEYKPRILTAEQACDNRKRVQEFHAKNRSAGLCRCGRKPLRNLTRCQYCR